MARTQKDVMTRNGYTADVYEGRQSNRNVFLAVALFPGYARAGASYFSAEDALEELDITIAAKYGSSSSEPREDEVEAEWTPDVLFGGGEDSVTEDDTRDLQARYDQLFTDYTNLEEEIDGAWYDVVKEKDAEIDELRADINEFEDELFEAESIRSDLEATEAKLADAEDEIEGLRDEISELESDLAIAESRVADLEFDLEESNDRIKDYTANPSIW